ncbi:hypothetical protein BGZ96_005302 [Linnemannia gamsii]|uniref:Maintenance of telomere capping protein 6 n=1 Tax=Linnemannia gamsii TaxID=64522 RepID=A0ABQ7K5H3_9FUNG|nr:hypothetical protein BGZ96_005302 [Linnemannia gamsii]
MEEGPDTSPTVHKRASPLENKSRNSPKVTSANNITKPNHNSNQKGAEAKNKDNASHAREWFRKKKRPVRPPIKPKSSGINGQQPMASDGTGSSNRATSRYAALHHLHRGAPHRLAMSKGIVASYNPAAAGAADQTVDGITCSSGEDIVLLLQALESWIDLTKKEELEDVLLIILNLNELNNNSLGSRPTTTPPPPTPTTATPAPPPGATLPPATPPPISNAEFFGQIKSPNTNRTINELAVNNMVSLRQLFIDAFPQLIYTPNLLEIDRADIEASWWKNGAIGSDYYNTSRNPITKKLEAPTGWPTSLYLRSEAQRRIVIGIGANNLAANSTYNITDDYATFHQQEVMGPSMTNSSLLQVSSTLSKDACSLPVPGVLQYPTGSEENYTHLAELRSSAGNITNDVIWSFASMADNDMLPWNFLTGRAVTAMTIWSWDLNQPPDELMRDRSHRCGAMKSNGRWVVQDCNDKLPVACRKIDTSSQWMIYEKGAGNYKEVTCPEGYKFDVPRTARENQILYSAIQAYWNTTASASPSSVPPHSLSLGGQVGEKYASSLKPVLSRLTEAFTGAFKHLKEREDSARSIQPRRIIENNDDDEDDENEEDSRDARANNDLKAQSVSDEQHQQQQQQTSGGRNSTSVRESKAEPTIMGESDILIGGGVIWIDISSWQTAGCWVPGGSTGLCPYQEPDNTVALQEIIKVSAIGGVITLVLVVLFLYVKFRRNRRLRKASRRRADVRCKILLTEVETVPA